MSLSSHDPCVESLELIYQRGPTEGRLGDTTGCVTKLVAQCVIGEQCLERGREAWRVGQ